MRKQVVGAREMFFLSPHCLHTPNFLGKGDNADTTILKITN